jgi:hypothetical protein
MRTIQISEKELFDGIILIHIDEQLQELSLYLALDSVYEATKRTIN